MKWKKTLVAFCCLFALLNVQTQAQDEKKIETTGEKPISDEASESYETERFLWGDGNITSVGKRPQKITEVASSVYIITRDDIESLGALRIEDVLSFVPELLVFFRNSNDSEAISQGFPQQYSPRLLVLMDGVTIYNSFTGGVFWPIAPISIDAIERIEVIHGPSSVLYGANAFSGVINIITRKPEDFKGVRATAYGGNLGNYGAKVLTTLPVGEKSYFRFSGEYLQSNGYGGHNGDDQDDPIKSGIFLVDGFIDINKNNKLRLGTWYRHNTANLPINSFFPANKVTGDDIYSLAQWESQWSPSNLLKVYTFFEDQLVTPRDATTPLKTNLIKYDLQVENLWNHRDKNFLTLGSDYRFNSINTTFTNQADPGDDNIHMFSLYANDEWKISDHFILSGGARYEYDSLSKNNWAARFNFNWIPTENHVLRTSVTRAIRTPSMYEEEITLTFPVGENIFQALGNPNLKAESVINAELGYVGTLLDGRLRINGDFYYNHVDDLIAPVASFQPPNFIVSNYLNVGGADLYGFEYGLRYRIFDWWDLTYNHSLTAQNNNQPNGTNVGKAPRNIINVINKFSSPWGLSGAIAFNWTSPHQILDVTGVTNRDIGNLYRLDLRVAQKFLKDQLELAFVTQGLIDYPRIEFEPTLRTDRRFFGTLTYQFKK